MKKHKHEHCCKHSNLAYCEVCRVVYCKDCGKEWIEKTYWTYSNVYSTDSACVETSPDVKITCHTDI